MKYFAMLDGEQKGPFTLEQLADAGVTPDTYIWCKGMPDWVQAREDGEVCRYFRRRLFDKMHPAQQITNAPDVIQHSNDENFDDVPLRYRGVVQNAGEMPQFQEPQHEHVVPPRSRMVEAVLVTILCCPLTGIVAIYFAHKINELWLKGQKNESYEMARRAKMWIGITLFVGVMLNATLAMMLNRM